MSGIYGILLAFVVSISAAPEKRPLDFGDIIEQREPLSPRISPDGSKVAFLVRQASLQENSTKLSLWLASPGSTPKRLLEERSISLLEWIPDGTALTVSLSRSGNTALWQIPVNGDRPRSLFEHPTRIASYAWSPDSSGLLFVTTDEPSPAERARIDREGIVYDETIHGIRNFTQRNWTSASAPQIWLWRRGKSEAERVAVNLSAVKLVGQYSWSPDAHHIAIEYVPNGGPNLNMTNHIGVLTLDGTTGKPQIFTPLVTTPVMNRWPQWHPKEGKIIFVSTGSPQRFYSVKSVPETLQLGTGRPVPVAVEGDWFFLRGATFDAAGDHLLFEYDNRSRSTLYRVPASGGKAQSVVGGTADYSGFHFSQDKKWAVCIRQDFTEPPEVVLIRIETGETQVLTRLNPQFDSIRLQPAVERRWRNRYGHETNGFLILPSRFERGRPVPLLVIQYNFSNKFTTQAQWMTSYPAQHFAEVGFAVLLFNYPRELGWEYGDFRAAALSQAYNPLASLEAAVQSLIDEGIVDPKRKGIMGWSFGAWLAEMVITQSRLFQVASAGEGGLNNAGQYWITGSAAMQHYLDAFFGGPPFGEAFKNYQELAPALNAHRVNIPLLREYGSDVGVQSLEFYMALRRLGKPVEQVIYPGASHIFSLPSQRKKSLERNLDWFRFWLQDYEDPALHKKAQYERWRVMKAQIR